MTNSIITHTICNKPDWLLVIRYSKPYAEKVILLYKVPGFPNDFSEAAEMPEQEYIEQCGHIP